MRVLRSHGIGTHAAPRSTARVRGVLTMAHERFPPDLLVQPASHRLAYFRSYTVAHPVLQAVDSAVKRALREPAGGSLVLVMGPTGVGKTTLRLRIEQHLRNTFVSAAKA